MKDRLTTAQSTGTKRRFGPVGIVTLAAMAALIGLPGGAAAKQARQPVEAVAQREAGEPVMAIVSIKGHQVPVYDADGWILRAPVSPGKTGRATPAAGFAVIQKG